MTEGNYKRLCNGYLMRQTNESRKLRLLVSALTGKSQRQLWELPGDWDDTPKLLSREENEAILNKYGCLKRLQEIHDGKS